MDSAAALDQTSGNNTIRTIMTIREGPGRIGLSSQASRATSRIHSRIEQHPDLDQAEDGQMNDNPEIEVNLITDMETTELDARNVGNSMRRGGFDGVETSVHDNQPYDDRQALPEKGSFAPSPEHVAQLQRFDRYQEKRASIAAAQ